MESKFKLPVKDQISYMVPGIKEISQLVDIHKLLDTRFFYRAEAELIIPTAEAIWNPE